MGLFVNMASTEYIIKNMIRMSIENLVRKFNRTILLADRWNRRKNELPGLIWRAETSDPARRNISVDNTGWLHIDPDNSSF